MKLSLEKYCVELNSVSLSLSREGSTTNNKAIDSKFKHPKKYSRQPASNENAETSTSNRFDSISNSEKMTINGDSLPIQDTVIRRPADKSNITRPRGSRRSSIDNSQETTPPVSTKRNIKPPLIHTKGIQIKTLLKTFSDNNVDDNKLSGLNT